MRIGIIICDRYKNCEGGKCFRSARNHEGAFRSYPKGETLEIIAYTTCGGCPGGNVEDVVTKMKKYGADVIHFATGLLAGYPPCPFIEDFEKYVKEKTSLPVIIGTHPMPTNYINMHKKLGDWSEYHLQLLKNNNLLDKDEVEKYDSSKSEYEKNLLKELSLSR
ncbi:MAG: CGGC domain-containing protein [Candidatus Hodarchaeales archaeon]